MTTIPESEVMQLHAEVCAALSEPKRIMIIYELAAGPRHVTDLAAALHSPQPVISRHLKVLRGTRRRRRRTPGEHGASTAWRTAVSCRRSTCCAPSWPAR